MASKTSSPYLVSRNLAAYDAKSLLKVREFYGKSEKPAQKSPEVEDRPLVESGQKLQVGKTYRSSANDLRAYYLPDYKVALDNESRPRVELRFQPGGADDEIFRLTINASWTPLRRPNRKTELRVMEHRADLVLRYRVPIKAADGSNTSAAGAEQTVTLQPLVTTGGARAQSVTNFADKESFEVVYHAMRTASSDARLEINLSASVWLRTYRQILLGSYTSKIAARTYLTREATMMRFVAKSNVAQPTGNRSASHARIAIARPAAPVAGTRPARPELRLREDTVVRPVGRVRRMEAAPLRPAIQPGIMMAAARPATAQPVRRATLTPATAAVLRASATRPVAARPATVRAARPAARPATAAPAARSTASFTAAAMVNFRAPALTHVVAKSDQTVKGRKVVPSEMALDKAQKPALLDTTLKTTRSVGFHFDPANNLNSGVFIGPDMGGIHLFTALPLVSDSGKTYTVYQDNLMPDVLHVDPSVFRLVRESLSPHRPSISFVGSEFSTSENDTEAEVFFQMMMVYRLEPWIDPELMQLARDTLAAQGQVARFVASVSSDASLELELDFLGDEKKRVDAEIDINEGVTDSLMLDEDAFVQLWRDRLGTAGEGVKGTVRHRLIDGTETGTTARISFWETSDELFDASFIGPVSGRPGHYKVSIRNRIESPAVIQELPGEALDGNAIAHAVDAASVLGTRLRPQETIELEYSVTPVDAPVVSLDPLVIGEIEPDLPALLRMMMVNSGAGSLGFTLSVRAADGTFAPVDSDGASGDVLTGLDIEFDDGRIVELDASQPEVEVTVTSRLINALMGTPDEDKRYFYRVTNIHPTGEGARTGWLEGHGDETLEVGHAVVQLD